MDTNTVATEQELALLVHHTTPGWALKAKVIYKDGHDDDRSYLCDPTDDQAVDG